MTTRLVLTAALALVAATAAVARQPDGTLGMLLTPNNGVPAMLSPGEEFPARLAEPATLALVGTDDQPVAGFTAVPAANDPLSVACKIDMNVPPGCYALQATAGGKVDRNSRAVYVLGPVAEYYIVAQLTDTHIGSARHPRNAADILRDAIKAVNESGASFALVTGDLTDSGDPEQFRQFLAAIDTAAVPTFVCPGNHDRAGRFYEQFFGPTAYRFRYGLDGYLAVDTKDYVMADDLEPQPGQLEAWRRELKACRWSVGFSHRYIPLMGMHAQLALFVDAPLDLFLMGHFHEGPPESYGKTIPWGMTQLVVARATIDGFVQFVDVTPKGVRPRPPQQVAAIE